MKWASGQPNPLPQVLGVFVRKEWEEMKSQSCTVMVGYPGHWQVQIPFHTWWRSFSFFHPNETGRPVVGPPEQFVSELSAETAPMEFVRFVWTRQGGSYRCDENRLSRIFVWRVPGSVPYIVLSENWYRHKSGDITLENAQDVRQLGWQVGRFIEQGGTPHSLGDAIEACRMSDKMRKAMPNDHGRGYETFCRAMDFIHRWYV